MAGLFFQQYSKLSVPIPLANLKLWLRADAGITLNGSTVSVWADQSGNASDATQGLSANQPLFVANALNGKPSLRFDGNNDYMTTSAFSQSINSFTIYLVGSYNSGAFFGNATNRITVVKDPNNNKFYMVSGSSYCYYSPSAYPLTNNIYKCVYNGSKSAFTKNGYVVGGGDLTSLAINSLVIGKDVAQSLYLNGDIEEIIIYDGIIDSTKDYIVQLYLSNKYGILINKFSSEVPNMTSDTAPSGTVTYSSQVRPAYQAFDGKFNSTESGGWLAATNYPQWLCYQFPIAKIITKYSVSFVYSLAGDYSIKDFKLQGSNNGTAWTDLDTQTGVTGFLDNPVKTYSFANTTAYLYYRLYVTGGNNASYIYVTELQLSE